MPYLFTARFRPPAARYLISYLISTEPVVTPANDGFGIGRVSQATDAPALGRPACECLTWYSAKAFRFLCNLRSTCLSSRLRSPSITVQDD